MDIISPILRGQKRGKTNIIPCSFEGSCVVCTVSRHSRFTQKEHMNNRKVVTERDCCVIRVADLIAIKIPREWILFEDCNNANDE